MNFLSSKKTTCMWQTIGMKCKCDKCGHGKCDGTEEDFECIMKLTRFHMNSLSAYSDTLYDKHKIKTSLADERIEDEGYGMNNESTNRPDQSSKGSVTVERR